MRKLFAILIAAAIVSVLAPSTSAAEDKEEYAIGGGFFVTGVAGLSVMCDDFCYEDDDLGTDLEDDIPGFGGVALLVEGSYNSLSATPDDDVFSGQAGISACFFHPDGDNVCETGANTLDGLQDIQSDWKCGTVTIADAPFSSNEGIVWALSFVVDANTNVCGATHGFISGEFFDV